MEDYRKWREQLSRIDLNSLSDEKREQIVKLRLGLRLLGDEKARRWFEYMRTSTRLEEWRKRPDPFELGKIVGSMHTLAPEFQGKAERELRARAEEAYDFYGKDLGWRETDRASFFSGYDEAPAVQKGDESPEQRAALQLPIFDSNPICEHRYTS
jgi:hypothetical protein